MKFRHLFTLSLFYAALILAAIFPMALSSSAAEPVNEQIQMSDQKGGTLPEETLAHAPPVQSSPIEEVPPTTSEPEDETLTIIETTPVVPEIPVESTEPEEIEEDDPLKDKLLPDTMTINYEWNGDKLTARKGYVYGPSGKETWYNLDMTGVIWLMEKEGIYLDYWVDEETGLKMYGEYIMCAADLSKRPRGTIVETSLGLAMVCDFCRYAADSDPTHTHIDIATAWK